MGPVSHGELLQHRRGLVRVIHWLRLPASCVAPMPALRCKRMVDGTGKAKAEGKTTVQTLTGARR